MPPSEKTPDVVASGDLDRIFEPFEQGTDFRQKSIPGIGLGLTIVRDIVRAIGGRLQVSSEVGVGTRFTVTFPKRSTNSGTVASNGKSA